MTRTRLQVICVTALTASLAAWTMAADNPIHKFHQSTSQPAHHEHFGKMPGTVDQTLTRQNSPQDELRIDITKSESVGGKYVAYVRVLWGDLDNLIKGGGKQYYSDWDGQLSLASGTANVVHEIAFDDGKPTTRPAGAHKLHAATTRPAGTEARLHPRHKLPTTRPSHGEPGPGSGRDELEQSSGNPVTWKAGVVGAYDGLLIKITSDSATPSGTVKAGKFSVDFKVNAAK